MDFRQETASSLRVGSYVVFDGNACIVKSIQISKTGKHGHAKCRIEASTISDGRKIVKVMPGTDKVQIPIVEKKTAQILSVSGNTANVMDLESYETFDLDIPDNLKSQVKENMQVVYWIVMGSKVMMQVK